MEGGAIAGPGTDDTMSLITDQRKTNPFIFVSMKHGCHMARTVYLIVDPMCSWCWGFRPVWDEFQASLPDEVVVVDLMGGLAPDTEQPMDAPPRDSVSYTHLTLPTKA